MAKYTPMIEQYLEIKQQYEDCILFFQLGDFYEMFFDHAHTASRVLGIALTGRDAGQEERIPMCGIPLHALDNYLPKLIEKGYKVAICEQTQTPAEAKGMVKREVTRVVTPGITLEDKILDEQKNHYIACLVRNQGQVALAIADITTGDFFCSFFDDHSPKRIINEIITYAPKEVLLTFSDCQWEHALADAGLYITNMTASQYDNLPDPLETFAAHFSQPSHAYAKTTTSMERLATGWLLAYMQSTQKRHLYHLTNLQKRQIADKMVLDYNARRNLELTETLRGKEKNGSLLGIIDKTVTSMGARMLRTWIESPLMDTRQIAERLDAIEELRQNPYVLEQLQTHLKNTYDIERLISKLSYGTANARDLVALKNSLLLVPPIKELLREMQADAVRNADTQLADVSALVDYLEQALLDNPPLSVKEGGMIRDGFHKQLDEYRHIGRNGKNWIVELERQEREKTKIKSLKVGFNKVFGYYIEVTKSNLAQVPDTYQRKQTLANAERYITDELKVQEELILKAEDSLIDLEWQIFVEIREFTLTYLAQIQAIAKALATLDVFRSLAVISIANRYVRPQFNTDGKVVIEQGRHPVVEKVIDAETYVPNDVFLDDLEQQIQLITGPNMAGKSTYMRQTALIVIMAQIGSFVPAESANLCVVDRIFTRIGASDDLASGQSTFMVEMVETKEAVLEATANSLILLDEVGRGTSTYDGMALAHAIIEYIHQHVKAKTLFSTHYHELTQLSEIYPSVVNYNARCIEKDQRVIFLHQIEPGKADKSYGVYVAHIAGMPLEITARAKELLLSYEKDVVHNEQSPPSQQISFFEQPEVAVTNAKQAKKDTQQSVSDHDRELLQEVKNANIISMTPIEAMNFLFDLQNRLKK